jgi:hypothetical protein
VFVRRKKVNGNTYYQLVRNYREILLHLIGAVLIHAL